MVTLSPLTAPSQVHQKSFFTASVDRVGDNFDTSPSYRLNELARSSDSSLEAQSRYVGDSDLG